MEIVTACSAASDNVSRRISQQAHNIRLYTWTRDTRGGAYNEIKNGQARLIYSIA